MQNMKTPTTIKESLQANYVIWLFLLIGQIVFFLVSLVLTLKIKKEFEQDFSNILLVIGIFLPMALIFISLNIFNQRIQEIDKSINLIEKISQFRTASIIRWALIEACVFLNLVFALADGQKYHFLLAFIFLGFFFSTLPSRVKISNSL